MKTRNWQTDPWLWTIAAAGLFIAFGFIDPLAGKTKGEHSLWSYFTHLGSHNNTGAIIDAIVLRSVLQAGPAVLLGWLIQAVAVVCGLRLSSRSTPTEIETQTAVTKSVS